MRGVLEDEEMVIIEDDPDCARAGEATPAAEPSTGALEGEGTRTQRRQTATQDLRPMVDQADIERGRRQVEQGATFAEVGLVLGSGFSAIERLRTKRSLLLLLYVGGCVLVVGLVLACLAATLNRPVRIAPTQTFVAQVDNADVTPQALMMTAEFLVARINTWSQDSMDDAVEVVVDYLDPKIREKVRGDFVRLRRSTAESNLMRLGLPIGSSYMGSENDIHTVWVAFSRLEATGGESGRDSQVHRRVRAVAIMDFVAGAATDENRRGIYLLRLEEYEEEAWRRLGGPDVWASFRQRSRERHRQ